MGAPRVLVTGIGLVTPLGVTAASTWAALLSSATAVAPAAFPPALPVQIAAAVPRHALPPVPPFLTNTPAFAAFALVAADAALRDAALLPPAPPAAPPYAPARAGVSIGVGMPHLPDVVATAEHLARPAYRRVTPFLVPRILPNTPAGLVALRHALRGPTLAPATACAAGAHALGDALHALRRRDADLMLAGGAEAAIHPVAVAGFARANALTASSNRRPARASRPFDASRDGFVLGEGACVMVLETERRVRQRAAPAYAALAGFGMSGDAHHITSPAPDGAGAIRAMHAALRSAARKPAHVRYVNAHATSTPLGDAVERYAIARVLHANPAAVVSSTKGATGHLLGAAGAVEAAFAAMAVAEGVVPPTLNLEKLDQDETVTRLGWGDVQRYVPNVKREMHVDLALSNSFGFGGTNACVAFTRVPDGIEQKRVAQPVS